MKDIVNQFKGYIDKLPDDKKQSLAKTIGTVLGLGAGAGVGSIIGSSLSSSSDEGSSQYPINSGITPNTNIVTKDSMAEMFPYSDTSTGEGIYSYREGTVTEAVEKSLQSHNTPIFDEYEGTRYSREYLAEESNINTEYTAHFVDGTTATIQGDSESLTDGLSTARWNFSDNPPHGSTPIQNEIYLEGENSNLNGVFDMPFASDRAEQMYRNTEWANGRLNLESGVVKEVAYYTVKLDKYDPEHYLKEIIKRNT